MDNLKLSSLPSEKDRWWAALSYVFSPILPIILLALFDLDDYPFLKEHIYQSLAVGILFLLSMPIILPSTLCIGSLFWLIMPYWCLQAYMGQSITIPWVTEWVKNQR